MTFVVFRHENEEFVLQNDQVVMKKYYREFNGEKNVDFISKSNHIYVKMFFDFLGKGKVPEAFEDQIQVLCLINEWECNFLVVDSFRLRIQSQFENGFVSHQNKVYAVNIGCFYFHSSVFQEFYLNNPHGVFSINHVFSPKSVLVFLDLLHCRIKQPEIGDIDEVLEICRLMGCYSLCVLINQSSREPILSTILGKQHEDSFDFRFYENIIIENLESYLPLVDFGQVCLPFLSRVFQKTKSVFPISLFLLIFHNSL